jgi:hypothetical protein
LPGDEAAFLAAVPFLARALKDATWADLRREIDAGTAQLWLALDGDATRAACVTQSGGDTLHFWLCGGDGCDWPALFDGIASAARGRFSRCTIAGRRGWARVLGFVERGGEMERAI